MMPCPVRLVTLVDAVERAVLAACPFRWGARCRATLASCVPRGGRVGRGCGWRRRRERRGWRRGALDGWRLDRFRLFERGVRGAERLTFGGERRFLHVRRSDLAQQRRSRSRAPQQE